LFALKGFAAPLFIPLDHPVYASLYRLQDQGFLPQLDRSALPWTTDRVLELLTQIDTVNLNRISRIALSESAHYLKEWKSDEKEYGLQLNTHLSASGWQKKDTTGYHNRGYLGAAFTYGRFFLVNRIYADVTTEKNRFDHLERQFKKTMPTDVPEAYVAFAGHHSGIVLGRNEWRLGPGRSGGLMLSDHQPPMTGLMAWTGLGFLEGRMLSAKLNPLEGEQRYFSASRVSFRIIPSLILSLSQSVVYADTNRSFEPYYVIPSFIYYFSQFAFTRRNGTENVFVGADIDFRLPGVCRAYAEFLADDFQVDDDSISRGVQNAIGYLIGVSTPEAQTRPAVEVEWVHLNSNVYKHLGGLSTHYLANLHGGILGHPLGPDAEALLLSLSQQLLKLFRLRLDYELVRRGELNDARLPWDGFGKSGDPVPFGRIETTHSLSLGFNVLRYYGFEGEARAGYEWIRNFNHQPRNHEAPLFSLKVDYCFDFPIQWNGRESLIP